MGEPGYPVVVFLLTEKRTKRNVLDTRVRLTRSDSQAFIYRTKTYPAVEYSKPTGSQRTSAYPKVDTQRATTSDRLSRLVIVNRKVPHGTNADEQRILFDTWQLIVLPRNHVLARLLDLTLSIEQLP